MRTDLGALWDPTVTDEDGETAHARASFIGLPDGNGDGPIGAQLLTLGILHGTWSDRDDGTWTAPARPLED